MCRSARVTVKIVICMIPTIDVTTAKNLELLSCSRDPASHYSLAHVINFTKTRGGGMSNHWPQFNKTAQTTKYNGLWIFLVYHSKASIVLYYVHNVIYTLYYSSSLATIKHIGATLP